MVPSHNNPPNQPALVALNVDYIGSKMSNKREVSLTSITILNGCNIDLPFPPIGMQSLP